MVMKIPAFETLGKLKDLRNVVWAKLRLHWLQPIYMPKSPSPHTSHTSHAEASTQCLGRVQPALISAAFRVHCESLKLKLLYVHRQTGLW